MKRRFLKRLSALSLVIQYVFIGSKSVNLFLGLCCCCILDDMICLGTGHNFCNVSTWPFQPKTNKHISLPTDLYNFRDWAAVKKKHLCIIDKLKRLSSATLWKFFLSGKISLGFTQTLNELAFIRKKLGNRNLLINLYKLSKYQMSSYSCLL